MYSVHEMVAEDTTDSIDKLVYAVVANNEKLPFPDAYFDCYMANLSLMIVNDFNKQISEAYRVLEEGGCAGFTVWGRKEHTEFFTFFPEILERNGVTLPEESHTNFHLNDKDKLEASLVKAGFKHPKLFYAPNNKPYYDAEKLYGINMGRPTTKAIIEGLGDEQIEAIKQDYISEFNKRFGPNSSEPLTFEILFAVAWK